MQCIAMLHHVMLVRVRVRVCAKTKSQRGQRGGGATYKRTVPVTSFGYLTTDSDSAGRYTMRGCAAAGGGFFRSMNFMMCGFGSDETSSGSALWSVSGMGG